MRWFGRKKRKPGKLKEPKEPAAAVTDRLLPVTEQTHLTRKRSQRGRRSSRSTDSKRDVEKMQDIHPALRKEAYFPQLSSEDITALPVSRRLQYSPHLRPVTTQEHGTIPYNFHQSHSHASLPAPPGTTRGRGKLQRPQSLRQPASNSMVRRISSKRQKEHDHIREEEIRALSFPMPRKRPAGSSGGMLRRDSKKVKGALNHRFERPTSNVSLPVEDSVHSSMSGNSERRAFRVSALDMFSPRPTIRCSVGSNYYATDRTSPTSLPARNDSRRERRPLSGRDEKQQNRTSRIDDLADELDAGELRHILERDKRQKDKKARADQERLRRRLERRAEKQNAAPAEIVGTPRTPRRSATGVVGLGIEKDMSMPMEDVRPSTPPQPQWVEVLPLTPKHENSQLPTPLESPTEEAVVADARAIRYSRGSVSGLPHTRGPSNVSMLPELISERLAQEVAVESVEQHEDPFRSGSLHPVDTVETMTTNKQGSTRRRSSEGRRMGVFASLFRRGKRNSQDQGRTTPSEISFSNTSRESMSRQPLPAHLVGTTPATQPIQIVRPSSVPRRTMSKFREHLPEFPISPPDSRVQSPEVPATSAIAARRRSHVPADLRVESLTSPADARSDSPVSPTAPTNVMSQSLASVDSEASWLSGKPRKRASNLTQLRSSVASSSVPRNENFNASYEELGMADDEYFRRLTPQPDDLSRMGQSNDLGRKASSTLMALDTAAESEEEIDTVAAAQEHSPSSEEEFVQRVPGRQPTIIHRHPRVKSREGLLSFYTNDKSKVEEPATTFNDIDMPDSPTSDAEPIMVQRAESVNLGKNHVRHLSAGSAKLLDIQKRSSTASRRKGSDLE